MTMLGKNIRQAHDPLQKILLSELYLKIENPKQEVKDLLKQLKTIASIDHKRYNALKTQLPYFTCGIFHPAFRKKEHFAWIKHFVLDIDHLTQKELSPDTLKNRISEDPCVHYAFTSPSGQGLKIIFELREKCYDAGKFSVFYKLFARKFSEKYKLDQVLDQKTSDVTRACFLSYDPQPMQNPFAQETDMKEYIDFDKWEELSEAKKVIREAEKESKKEVEEQKEILSPDIIQQIRNTLNPNIKTRREKIIYVPEKLEEIIESVKKQMAAHGIQTMGIQNIHYGKKFIFEVEYHKAEINVFYGKKGFSIVKTPKRGTSEELADLTHKLLCELFY
jgi:hypothetical protein